MIIKIFGDMPLPVEEIERIAALFVNDLAVTPSSDLINAVNCYLIVQRKKGIKNVTIHVKETKNKDRSLVEFITKDKFFPEFYNSYFLEDFQKIFTSFREEWQGKMEEETISTWGNCNGESKFHFKFD